MDTSASAGTVAAMAFTRSSLNPQVSILDVSSSVRNPALEPVRVRSAVVLSPSMHMFMHLHVHALILMLVLVLMPVLLFVPGCDSSRCETAETCPDDAPYCGASGRCTAIRPPDVNPIGSGDPIDDNPDAGSPSEPVVTNPDPLVCTDDSLEDNDTRATATTIAEDMPVAGRVCGEDDDWYAIASMPGCSVVASLTQSPASGTAGDIDMLLFDPNGALVGTANTPLGSEVLSAEAIASGMYALRLRAGARDDVAYELSMRSVCADDFTCPADDSAEDNDDAARATPMVKRVTQNGVVCGSDDDWFSVPVTPGCIADVHLAFSHDAGDLDVEFHDSDSHVRARSLSITSEERIARVVPDGGATLRVFLANQSGQNTYRLLVDDICLGQLACPTDDPFEPNEERFSGPSLFAGVDGRDAADEVIGVVCDNDDHYQLAPQAGCSVRARLQYTAAEGDLDMEVVNTTDGSVVARSTGSASLREMSFDAATGAQVAFRVFGVEGASNVYRLSVTTDCP